MGTAQTLLVVDDDPAALAATVRLCRQAGFTVEQAVNGTEALRQVRVQRPRLVLLDAELPDIVGLEVLRQIRADAALDTVAVVFLSARQITVAQQAAALEAGADGYIARPIANVELLARVRAQWRQSETNEALRASKARFRNLVTLQADGVLVVDGEGMIRFANPAAETLFGRPAQELVGAPFGFPVAGPGNFQLEVLQPGGKLLIAEMRAAPISWQGEPGWIASLHDITERKRAEAASLEAEQRFRGLFERHQAIMLLIEPHSGAIEDANQAAAAFYGWPLAELRRMNIGTINCLPPAEVAAERERALAEQRNYFVFPHRLANGEIRTVEVHSSPIVVSGRPVLFSIIHDITARTRVETTLRESEHLLRESQRAAGLGNYVLDIPSGRWHSSPMLDQVFGIDAAHEHSVAAWTALVHPDDRDMMAAYLRDEVVGRGQRFDKAYRICRHADQAERWVHGTGKLEFDDAGHPVRLIGLIQDITERKQAEAALRESQERYQLLFENSADAILLTIPPDGRVLAANPAACRMFGWTLAELCQFGRKELADARDPLLAPAMAERERTGRFSGELNFLRADGQLFLGEVTTRFFRGERGQQRTSLIIRDVTERRQAEDALKRAKETAEAATRSKSEFLANMSHEIRTPMNGVIGMTHLLLDTELTAEQRRYAETVRNSAESLLTVLNGILDFSKIEAGKLALEMVDFDLRGLLDDCTALLAPRAREKGVEFICVAAPDVPAWLTGDPGRLRQVLLNLAGNAVKFTSQGEISVRASLEPTPAHPVPRSAGLRPGSAAGSAGLRPGADEPAAAGPEAGAPAGVVLRFSIKDTGIGIPAAKQALLFQKFSQVDTSTTRRYGGTGLGLAIAKELVTRMGGEIGVVSEEGRGAEFWFTVRLTPPRTAVPAASPPATPLALCRGRGRILLAEDNPTNTEVARGILEKMGLPGDAVPNGADALRALASASYDVVLMDVQMPVMDGFEATHRIRQAEGAVLNPNLPIIAMTAHAMPGDRERCLAAGMNDYVQKPVSPEALATVLNRWLPPPRATGEAGAGQRPHPPAAGPAEVSAAPRPGRASVQVFNRANLLARVLGDQPLADRIIRGFLTDLPRQIERLRSLLEQGDAPGVERQAHSIKSAAASVGGEMLCATAFALEMAGKNGELQRSPDGLAVIQAQFDQLRQAMTADVPASAPTNSQPDERTQPPAISPVAQEL